MRRDAGGRVLKLCHFVFENTFTAQHNIIIITCKFTENTVDGQTDNTNKYEQDNGA